MSDKILTLASCIEKAEDVDSSSGIQSCIVWMINITRKNIKRALAGHYQVESRFGLNCICNLGLIYGFGIWLIYHTPGDFAVIRRRFLFIFLRWNNYRGNVSDNKRSRDFSWSVYTKGWKLFKKEKLESWITLWRGNTLKNGCPLLIDTRFHADVMMKTCSRYGLQLCKHFAHLGW